MGNEERECNKFIDGGIRKRRREEMVAYVPSLDFGDDVLFEVEYVFE